MTMLPPWIEIVVAALLALSGLFVLLSAIGFLQMREFFLRMHPPALAYTLGSWCVAGAGVMFFSALEGRVVLHPLLIPLVLAMTVPVTTVLLARVALFRQRTGGAGGPPPMSAQPAPDTEPVGRSRKSPPSVGV